MEEAAEANRNAIRLSSAFVPLIRIAIVLGFGATMVYGGVRTLEGAIYVDATRTIVRGDKAYAWPIPIALPVTDDELTASAITRANRLFERIASSRNGCQIRQTGFRWRSGSLIMM